MVDISEIPVSFFRLVDDTEVVSTLSDYLAVVLELPVDVLLGDFPFLRKNKRVKRQLKYI